MKRYKVGDTVRIKEDISDIEYMTDSMLECSGKIAKIVKADYADKYEDDDYYLDIVNYEDYVWGADAFEDVTDDNNDTIYIIGYRIYKYGRIHTFEGIIENFCPSGKSHFSNKNGMILLPYDLIEYIIPKESNL